MPTWQNTVVSKLSNPWGPPYIPEFQGNSCSCYCIHVSRSRNKETGFKGMIQGPRPGSEAFYLSEFNSELNSLPRCCWKDLMWQSLPWWTESMQKHQRASVSGSSSQPRVASSRALQMGSKLSSKECCIILRNRALCWLSSRTPLRGLKSHLPPHREPMKFPSSRPAGLSLSSSWGWCSLS